jgi:hypothetical protein
MRAASAQQHPDRSHTLRVLQAFLHAWGEAKDLPQLRWQMAQRTVELYRGWLLITAPAAAGLAYLVARWRRSLRTTG